jgi:hypothetical protein
MSSPVPPSTSCWAAPPWGTLPGVLLFAAAANLEGSLTVGERVKLQAFGAMLGALARSTDLPYSCRSLGLESIV